MQRERCGSFRQAPAIIVAAALCAWIGIAEAQSARAAPRFASADVGRVDALLRHIQARLIQAPKSAATKWSSMIRIEDADNEAKAIASVVERSPRLGLDSGAAQEFARAQIEATKSIEASRHRQWTLEASTAPRRNVERGPSEVAWPAAARGDAPIAIGDAELRALRDALAVLRRPGGREVLDARAADVIQVGGADLIAGQIALKPLYDLANPSTKR